MKIKSFEQVKNYDQLTVLVRVDFNVPVVKNKVVEDFKILACLPLLTKLVKANARVVVVTHLGEPGFTKTGRVKPADKVKCTVAPIAKKLSSLMKHKVKFLTEEIGGAELKTAVKSMKGGEIVVLENLRFYKGETANGKLFAKQLARLADVYINDAFAVCHRDHASVSRIKKYIKSYAGPLLITEVTHLHKILKPKKPFVAIIGGAKIDSKVGFIKALSKKANWMVVGGALATNFLAAKGYNVGKSLVTDNGIKIAKKLMRKNIVLPVDVVVKNRKTGIVSLRLVKEVGSQDEILDIGVETMKKIDKLVKTAQTIIWNGPMGKFEEEKFRFGTFFVARAVASRSCGKAFGVVGGGETIEAVDMSCSREKIDWVSTGGGASLSFLSGEKMPGLKGLI